MARKKVSRKELLKEPDKIFTASSRLLGLVMAHKMRIAGVLGFVFLAIICVSGIRYLAVQSETEAFKLLAAGVDKYEKALEEEDSEKACEKVQGDFEKIVEQFSSKKGGKMAAVTFGNILYAAGRYEAAITYYRKAEGGFSPALNSLIHSGLAYVYTARGDVEKAIRYFGMIADAKDAISKDEALFNLGILYEKKGDLAKSREAFKNIATNFTDSIYIDIARDKTGVREALEPLKG